MDHKENDNEVGAFRAAFVCGSILPGECRLRTGMASRTPHHADDRRFLLRLRRFAHVWLLLAGSLTPVLGSAQTTTVSVLPDADAFVSSMTPDSNYGAAGALSVSGSAAVNGLGEQEGLYDTLMRFPSSSVVATLNSTLGTSNWIVTGILLTVNEDAFPANAIFNRGVGAFQAFWLASDTWVEGSGSPQSPTTAGVTWNDLPGIVNTNLDVSLGVFTNTGMSEPVSFPLALAAPLVAQIHQGGEIGFHLTAANPEIGFTFYSRNKTMSSDWPELIVSAAVNPQPKINLITRVGTNVSISFATVSNWTYRLQASTAVAPAGAEAWQDLFIVPAQAVSSNAVYLDGMTNRTRFYRLSVSP